MVDDYMIKQMEEEKKNNKIALMNKYIKRIGVIGENFQSDYNNILSTFLLYCNEVGIEWSFPMIMGEVGSRDEKLEAIFNREFKKYLKGVEEFGKNTINLMVDEFKTY